jgi:hypothetical protein
MRSAEGFLVSVFSEGFDMMGGPTLSLLAFGKLGSMTGDEENANQKSRKRWSWIRHRHRMHVTLFHLSCLYPPSHFSSCMSSPATHINMSGYSSPRRDSSHPPSRHGLTTPTRSRNSSRAPSRIASRRGSLSSPAPVVDAVIVLTDSANFQDLPSVSDFAR